MRPVARRGNPTGEYFENYADAQSHLVGRLGPYCSYCERRLPTGLAVEHIQPKGLAQYAPLEGEWTNFLLACVNCNSTKGDGDVNPVDYYFPDRDNTGFAFQYFPDGSIRPAAGLSSAQRTVAEKTIDLTKLDRDVLFLLDENGFIIALDRKTQRMEAWGIARRALQNHRAQPSNGILIRQILDTAYSTGFFSIWMTVFESEPRILRLFIRLFRGTARDCYTAPTFRPASPRLCPSGLAGGGKI